MVMRKLLFGVLAFPLVLISVLGWILARWGNVFAWCGDHVDMWAYRRVQRVARKLGIVR